MTTSTKSTTARAKTTTTATSKNTTSSTPDDDMFAGVSIAPSSVLLGESPKKVTPRSQFLKAIDAQRKMLGKLQAGQEISGRPWFCVKDGRAYTFLRYNTKKVLLLDGMTEENAVYQVGKTEQDIAKFYEKVIEVVESGRYDELLESVAKELIEQRKEQKEKNKNNPEYQAKKVEAKLKKEKKEAAKAEAEKQKQVQKAAAEKRQAELDMVEQDHVTPDSVN